MWNTLCFSDLKKPSYSKSTRDLSFHFETPNCSLQLKVHIPEDDSDPFIPFMKMRSLQFSMCTLLWTLSKQIIQKTLEKMRFCSQSMSQHSITTWLKLIESFQFLLHTSLYVCMVCGFFFSPFLSLKKMGALFNQWKIIPGQKSSNVRRTK